MKKLLGIGAICAVAALVIGLTIYSRASASDTHSHAAKPQPAAAAQGGAMQNATVTFGGWRTTPAVDRFPNNNPIAAVVHALTPNTVTIKQGGTVNFIIGGFHNVVVYDDGTQPTDINTSLTVAPTNGGPPLINDANRRIYRGLDPSLFPQDRVETVQFDEPGTYLVICAVLPHFQDGMYGYVRVLPGRG